MLKFKETVIEIAAGSSNDIELLEFMLNNVGMGEVERKPRLLNIESLQYLQVTLGGRMFQPFRAEFAQDGRGHWLVKCRSRYEAVFAKEFIRQVGFEIVNIELGSGDDYEIPAGLQMVQTGTLNGRSARVVIGDKAE